MTLRTYVEKLNGEIGPKVGICGVSEAEVEGEAHGLTSTHISLHAAYPERD